MPNASQPLDSQEQNGQEAAWREVFDKIVASPPGVIHSTLEARYPDPVLYDSFKQVMHAQPRTLSSAEEVKATQNAQEESPHQALKGRHRIFGLQPKWFWVIVTSAIAAIAIIVGAVVGTIIHHNKGIDKQITSSGSTGKPVPSNSSHPASITRMNENSALASIAWNDVDNNPHYRLYWQGEDSTVRESSRNATQQNWTISSSPIGYARPHSPMAAVVTGPARFPFVGERLSAE